MSKVTRQLDRLLERINQTPYGPEERALIDEAITIADEADDVERGYAARAMLIRSASQLGDTEAMLGAFAWCLGMHDRDPVRFPVSGSSGDIDLLWVYKWMIPGLASSPIFSREQIAAALLDMQQRYAAFGAGRSGPLTAEYSASHRLGDELETERLRVVLAGTERDDFSDCEACTVSSHIEHFADTGRSSEAVSTLESMLENELSCSDEPEGAIAAALVSFLREGEFERAKSLHLSGYRAARSNPDNLGMIADHVRFCAVSGNLDRGITLVERHFAWLTWNSLNTFSTLDALQAFAVLLSAANAAGSGSRVVQVAASTELSTLLGTSSARRTVAELADACWSAAERIAGEFDARNGNRTFSAEVLRQRELVNERHEALIGAESVVLSSEPVPLPEPTSSREWFHAAREHWIRGERPAATAALRSGLVDAEGDQRALLLLMLARVLFEGGDTEAARAIHAERIGLLVSMGRDAEAQVERTLGDHWLTLTDDQSQEAISRLLEDPEFTDPAARGLLSGPASVWQGGRDNFENSLILSQAAVAAARAVGDLHSAARWAVIEAESLLRLGRFDDAEQPTTFVLGADSDRLTRAEGLLLRSQIELFRGQAAESLVSANEALALATATGIRETIVDAALTTARSLSELGRHDEAIARAHIAVRHADLSQHSDRFAVRYQLLEQLLAGGNNDEALEIAMDAYERRSEWDITGKRLGELLIATGGILQNLGQKDAAVGAWMDAVAAFESAGEQQRAAACELEIGQLLVDYDEPADAIDVLGSARKRLARVTDPMPLLVADVELSHGLARCRLGQKAGIKEITAALERIRGLDESWSLARAFRTLAFGHLALENSAEALSWILQASDAFAEVGDTGSAAMGELGAAELLERDGRAEEAVAILRSAVDRVTYPDHAFFATTIELADLLDRLGRTVEANEVRATLEDR